MEMSYTERVYGSTSNEIHLTSIDKKLIAAIENLYQNNGKLMTQRNCNLFYKDEGNEDKHTETQILKVQDTNVIEKADETLSPICQAKKKDGTNCSFKSKPCSNFCGRHIKLNKN